MKSKIVIIGIIFVLILIGAFLLNKSCNKEINISKDNIANQSKNNINTGNNNTNMENNNVLDMKIEEEQKEIYSKIVENKELLQKMVLVKDFDVTTFQDEEIVKLLPLLDNMEYFSINNENVAVANTSDVQKMAKKYFDREININNLEEKIENGKIFIETDTGYGIVEYELKSIKILEDNQYSVNIKYKENEKNTNYIFTVMLKDNEIVYLSLEKE